MIASLKVSKFGLLSPKIRECNIDDGAAHEGDDAVHEDDDAISRYNSASHEDNRIIDKNDGAVYKNDGAVQHYLLIFCAQKPEKKC